MLNTNQNTQYCIGETADANINLVDFPPFLQGGQFLLLPVCSPAHQAFSGKKVCSERKEFAQGEQMLSFSS